MKNMRLDKLVCDLFKLTRKQAKKEITTGKITVNGKVERQCAVHVDISDRVCWDGTQGVYRQYVYIMMNKPEGVLSATKDNRAQTALDLLPAEFARRDLFVAGRLDKNTTGFLLLTNDGDFAHNILSPKKHIKKTYIAKLKRSITAEDIKTFAEGIALKDFVCQPAKLVDYGERLAKITVVEGKFHQIKRMFLATNNEVLALHRCKMGGLELDESLLPGESRYITDEELSKLKDGNQND